MPQLSLYIDEETLKKVEQAARHEKSSLSRWVVQRLRKALDESWPEDYGALFGLLDDPDFEVERDKDWCRDLPRESL